MLRNSTPHRLPSSVASAMAISAATAALMLLPAACMKYDYPPVAPDGKTGAEDLAADRRAGDGRGGTESRVPDIVPDVRQDLRPDLPDLFDLRDAADVADLRDALDHGETQVDTVSGELPDTGDADLPDLLPPDVSDAQIETADAADAETETETETVCTPDCTDKQCGPDGCGGDCGTCPDQHLCVAGICVCIPDCTDKQCGPDGCDGNCGTCDDQDVCTDDACDPGTGGCVSTPIPGCCHNSSECDDGDKCTDDSCDPAGGCVFTPNDASVCDDGNKCTTGDQCVNGNCATTGTLPCDDGNPCTEDSCDPSAGCVFTPNEAECSDDDPCTVGDECSGGKCVPGASNLPCDDGNDCTVDECKPVLGCEYVPVLDGTACTPVDACALGSTCKTGACVATASWKYVDKVLDQGVSYGALLLPDGGYAVSATYDDMRLIRLDAALNVMWTCSQKMGGSNPGRYVVEIGDGTFWLVGHDGTHGRILHIDANGKLLWDKSYGSSTIWMCAQKGADSSIYAAGGANSDVYYAKLALDGSIVWSGSFGTAGGDSAWGIAGLPDGGAVLSGYVNQEKDPSGQGMLARIDGSGGVIWKKYYGGDGSVFYGLVATADGGYLVSGTKYANGERHAWLVRTDSAGGTLWEATYGAANDSHANDVAILGDGRIVLAGRHNGGPAMTAFVAFYDANGNFLFDRTWPAISEIVGLAPLLDGGLLAAGSGNPAPTIWLLRIDPWGHASCEEAGVCSGLSPDDCDDGNPCTEDSCDPSAGCVFTPNEAECSDDNSCTQGDKCTQGTCQPGAIAPVCLSDLDHDGLAGVTDTCPTVWNPDNGSGICAELPAGFLASRAIVLSEPKSGTGASTWRRTHEPVEVPLWNGILEDSVVGFWPFDNSNLSDLSAGGNPAQLVDEVAPGPGAFGGSDGLTLGGGYVEILGDNGLNPTTAITVMAWVRYSTIDQADLSIVSKWASNDANRAYWLGIPGTNHPADTQRASFLVSCDGIEASCARSESKLAPDQWYHVAGVFSPDNIAVYVDGRLDTGIVEGPKCGSIFSGNAGVAPLRIGAENGNPPAGKFFGSVDDVLVFGRALTPTEIAAYCQSRAAYGTTLVPGAQPDFDDVRVTEATPLQAEHQVPFEIIGPRPHSDTPCPFDDTDPTSVPHIEDREDLCGVVAYWRLDGNLVDSGPSGLVLDAAPQVYSAGRSGQLAGALVPADGSKVFLDQAASPGTDIDQLTVETWFLMDEAAAGTAVEQNDTCYTSGGWALRVWGGVAGPDAVVQPSPCPAAAIVAMAPSKPALNVWHHMAGVFRAGGGEVQVELFVDGLKVASASGPGSKIAQAAPLRIGTEPNGGAFPGKLDEVLIHAVAKSPEYIYRRANPGVPTVRFLASTEPIETAANEHAWYQYALHWGHPDALQTPAILTALDKTTECYGLLSPCLGYAGWWRFNEGSGTIAVDSSTSKNNAAVPGGGPLPGFVAGQEGTALKLDGQDDHLTVPAGASIQSPADEITMEAQCALVPHDTGLPGHTVVGKPLGYAPTQSNFLSYGLVAYGAGYLDPPQVSNKIHAFVTTEKPQQYNAFTDPLPDLEDGTWRAVAGTLDAGQLNVWAGGQFFAGDFVGQPVKYQDTPLYIGAYRQEYKDDLVLFLHGFLDSVRLMSRALTPDEFLHYPMAAWLVGEQNGCAPDCWGKDCGDDGCDGDCGTCADGLECVDGGCQ